MDKLREKLQLCREDRRRLRRELRQSNQQNLLLLEEIDRLEEELETNTCDTPTTSDFPEGVVFLDVDVQSWPITSQITNTLFSDGLQVLVHTKAGMWPVDGDVEGNIWAIVPHNGQRYATTFEWLRPGQVEKFVKFSDFAAHAKKPELSDYTPEVGQTIYMFATTHARAGLRTSNERTNVVPVVVS